MEQVGTSLKGLMRHKVLNLGHLQNLTPLLWTLDGSKVTIDRPPPFRPTLLFLSRLVRSGRAARRRFGRGGTRIVVVGKLSLSYQLLLYD